MCLAQGHKAVALVRRTHGHSVSSQAQYHDSKSELLIPENKLCEMKKNPAAIISQ